ncbi:MAG: neutral/alkaline non-lysosomal ceramidase N-terminal domain-containing protein [Ardenticatenaceae bacterium]|nr:neutral/alkaline non-lysosomal ceramidase N-terminal domain-containing protein [Ardenticatenaceae bacterium]
MTLQAGVVKIDITPPLGHPMAGCPRMQAVEGMPTDTGGYVPRECVAEGVHDPLYARVLVLSDGRRRVAFVAVDLLVVSLEFTNRLRSLVADATGIAPGRLMVAASHTHSGPDLYHWEGTDPAVESEVLARIRDAVVEASQALRPARVGWADTALDLISINRREAGGPIDERVGVMRVEDEDGRVLALAVNFAIHPIAVPCTNCLYSAGIPGYTSEALERAYDGATVLFLQGATGNINPVAFPAHPKENIVPAYRRTYHAGLPHPRTFRTAERLGRILAAAALQAAEQVQDLSAELPLSARTAPVELPRKPHAEVERYCRLMNFSPLYTARLLEREVVGSEVQVIAVGPTLYIALPGEPFVELGLWLQEQTRPRRAYVVGYANDDVRYVLPQSAYAQNRYDTLATPLDAGSAELLLARAHQLVSGFS